MNLLALFPLILLACVAVAALLLAAFTRHHALVASIGAGGMVLFLISLTFTTNSSSTAVAPLFLVDPFALFYWALIALATLVVMFFCYSHFGPTDDMDRRDDQHGNLGLRSDSPEELYGLLTLAALGACVLAASTHFISLFLGLELLSVSLFILIAYRCQFSLPVEAGIKYLVLSGLATGFLLFGMALVYTYSGVLSFSRISALPVPGISSGYWFAGMALVAAGLAFKLSLVPFHFWTPDVYQGAPAPITAFLATVSKTAVMAVLLRLTLALDMTVGSSMWSALAGIAAASMLVGNWLALRQPNLKRLLAYSSIAHMGYALAALLAAGVMAVEAVSFYLAFYVVTTLGAFGVIIALTHKYRDTEREADDDEAIRGLFWRHPFLALALTLMILSLAGIPLTAGFFGQFYVIIAGAEAGLWRLLLLVVVGSAIGLYYYLRVILTMLKTDNEQRLGKPSNLGRLNIYCLALLSAVVLWVGLYPQPLMAWARAAVGA